ncbi:putative short-chain dehydrogenase/reductase [Mycobacteroides stephanolepidis]|uniref:Putative short-chain dehydrogenase/reductase n=1 Tax=[Mycobacterium] stephanolepidis TaxID=1520670 RepID=A0A1Z4EWG5_9MYCO|nr:SDR family oxidoreductase [[Mycobacterium] stephanolepidis]BAX97284.1 putative short-chain dehydrogenase/reductase [[Mycobacterium] stephanolepidis]
MSRSTRSLNGKVVAVTGGARGIGRATAEAFLRAGAQVALGDIDTELVEKTAAGLAALTGGRVCGLHLDVRDRKSFAAFFDGAEKQLGQLDVLVNNAGIMPTGLFVDEDDAVTDRMVEINLGGVLNGSKLALQRFGRRGGHIINVASLAGVGAYPGLATYCATKHAVVGFSETLHLEVARSGIAVTAVLPGLVRTELSAGNSTPRWLRPIGEVEPKEVAAAIVSAAKRPQIKITVPKVLGGILKTMSLIPMRARHRIEHVAHFDTVFTNVDVNAREIYHRRIGGLGS